MFYVTSSGETFMDPKFYILAVETCFLQVERGGGDNGNR